MRRIKTILSAAMVAAVCAVSPALAQGELRIALQDDPDTLDPALNWSFVGRHVLQSMCDKLVDIDQAGTIVPMLATSWAWSADGKELTLKLRDGVVFHDGTPFDAEAARYNIDRALNMKTSRRKSEIDVIDKVEAADPQTVKITLKAPSIPLLSAFADRAGMMVSKQAAEQPDFARKPVCAGPYKFVEHKAQDRIVLERFPQHYRAKEFGFDRLVFTGIPDANVRLLNLRSNQVQLIERISPTDIAGAMKDKALAISESSSLGYFGITFNMANGAGVNADFARNKAVREAFDLAIDREAINQVVFEGRYEAGNQPFPPASPFYDKKRPVAARDVAAAKAKMKEAGLASAKLALLVPSDPLRQRVAEVVQAMVADAGITMTIQSVELMSLLATAREGKFEAHLVGWSGRVDPDLNITPLLGCTAAGNDGRWCNKPFDEALAEARGISDTARRKAAYDKIIGVLLDEKPVVYLYHAKWQFAHRAALTGFRTYPDGIIRLDGVSLKAP